MSLATNGRLLNSANAGRFFLRKLSTERVHPIIPKALDQIINKQLFLDLDRGTTAELWRQHFSTATSSVATTLNKHQWRIIEERKSTNESFVFPIVKAPGVFFVLFGQWKQKDFLFTYLEDYRKGPDVAEPYAVLSCYDDFIQDKGIVLLQMEFLPYLSRSEAEDLLSSSVEFYLDDTLFSHIHTFNKDSENFNFPEAFPDTLR